MKRPVLVVLVVFSLSILSPLLAGGSEISNISNETKARTVQELTQKYGEKHRFRIERGVARTASLWRKEDGSEKDFAEFCKTYFIADDGQLAEALKHIETNFEILWGHFHVISRGLMDPLELADVRALPMDNLFASYSPGAHLQDDLFKNKAAFTVTLNFPPYSLEEKRAQGNKWSRKQWAAAAAGDIFASRIPPEVNQKESAIMSQVMNYSYSNNIYMGKLLTDENKTLFPEDLKLLNHWGIRDRLRAGYMDPGGLEKQEMIYRLMLRTIDQSIPKQVIDNPGYYWNPYRNQVYRKEKNKYVKVEFEPEGGTRYKHFLSTYHGMRLLDPYWPDMPTWIERSFKMDRKIPEKVVEKLLISILDSPLAKKTGVLIEKRLGRPLRPFDIWYDGFKSAEPYSKEELDRAVKAKYPDLASFEADIPRILQQLGFSPEKAKFIAGRIVVDSSKGTGHALAAHMRSDKAHLRVRLFGGGMNNYMSYNFALHELGHNVEQVCSLHMIDHYLLQGIPNVAFTEAFAFMFGRRHLELLGLEKGGVKDPVKDLQAFWFAYETSGVALIDMKIWRWLYAHPGAPVSQFQEAVIKIAEEVWNRYFAPVFKEKDVPLLIIYSHLIGGYLYFPDYPVGQIISSQIEQYLEGKNFGVEMERMCKTGSVTPEYWMHEAVGSLISAQPLLDAAEKALKTIIKEDKKK